MSRRPFFGQGQAPQIAKMDMQTATAPGRMFFESLNNLGVAVGGAIAKHAENKEKKENQQLAENAFISAGMKPDQAKIASRDPQVGNMLQQFMQMDETSRVNDAQLALQGDQLGLAEEELGFNIEKYNEAQEKEDQLEAELEAGNRLMISPTERMPNGKEGRYDVLKNLRGGKGVTDPTKMIQADSPAVTELPEEFKKFGRDIERAVKDKRISPRVGMSLVEEKRAIAQAQATRKAEFDDKVNLELVKNEIKNQGKRDKDLSGSLVVNDTIDRSFGLISPFSTGFGSYLKSIPSTDALALDKSLETIKANIGFDKLQAMREASPTGGALGQVSNQELSSLQSVFGNLDQAQDDENLKYNLGLLRHVYNDVVHGKGNHPYLHPNDSDYSEILKLSATQQVTGDPNREASPELLSRYKELQEMERQRNLGFKSEMGNNTPSPVQKPPVPQRKSVITDRVESGDLLE